MELRHCLGGQPTLPKSDRRQGGSAVMSKFPACTWTFKTPASAMAGKRFVPLQAQTLA